MKTLLSVSYALTSYAVGMGALLYLMAFLQNIWVPKTIDSGAQTSPDMAVWSNLICLVLYLALHSLMARPWFKSWWIQFIPSHLERSTYVLVSGLTLFGLIGLWQPVPIVIWKINNAIGELAVYVLYALGWVTMVMATFNIGHFSFFGLQQPLRWVRRQDPVTGGFTARYLYSLTCHPISVGWLIVVWATPEMTQGHLLLALCCSAYIFVVTPIEEADLIRELGDPYLEYRKRVRPFLPIPRRNR